MSSPRSSRHRPLRLVAGLALPLIVFLVLRQAVGNATGALAITDAIPMLWLVAFGIWRRRIEPVVLIPVAVFTLALVLTITFGGSALPLELRRAVFPGTVGLACLISLAAGRPLLLIASTKLANARPELMARTQPTSGTQGRRRALTTLTAMVGITCVVDAAAQVVLALTVSTSTFAELARLASYTIIGGGLAVCAAYIRWTRARASRQQPRDPVDRGVSRTARSDKS